MQTHLAPLLIVVIYVKRDHCTALRAMQHPSGHVCDILLHSFRAVQHPRHDSPISLLVCLDSNSLDGGTT